jgi:Domain of unknown function (DUF3471)/Glyoxalase superfamily protein
MRDFRDAKAMAQTLRDAFTAKGVSLTHSESLELVARTLGFHDWNELAARIQSERNVPDTEFRGLPGGKPARHEIAVDAAELDGYVGFYQHTDNFVMTVTRDGNQLLVRLTGQSPVPIYPESNTEFFVKVVDAQISFITDGRGRAESLILHQNNHDMPMKRIDGATAQRIEGKRAEKLKSQSPSPGTEAALRHFIDGLISGKPNYGEMNSEVAEAIRNQLRELHAELAPLGSIRSIEFAAVGHRGEDIYVVKQEHGARHWRIMLDSRGMISTVLFNEGL